MFTGLVLETGVVESAEAAPGGARVLKIFSTHARLRNLPLGASVAINGACMTVVREESSGSKSLLSFEVSPESLARSNLGELGAGSRVHLEAAVRASDPLGGHIVSGHVDAVAELVSRTRVGDYEEVRFAVQGEAWPLVAPYLVPKGSVALDGVSLTVNRVEDQPAQRRTEWTHMIIPHTLEITRLGELSAGARVNIEADLLAKYLERQTQFRSL
jgi:riboflavin synthase